MGNDLGNFRRLHTIIEREIEIEGQLDRLIARDKGGDREHATIAERKTGPFPEIAQNSLLSILFERGRDRAEFFKSRHGMGSVSCCRFSPGRADDDQKERKQICYERSHCSRPSVLAGCAISQDATRTELSTVTALARNTALRPAAGAIKPSAGLAIPWAASRNAV